MRPKMNTTNERQSQRMDADREELAERIERALPHDGVTEPQAGVYLSRFATTAGLVHGFLEPCFCVIAQGAKALTFGDDVFRYDPAQYMISTVGLPMTAQVVEASAHRPYLGLRLTLDPAVVASVMVESAIVQSRGDGGVKAVDVSTLDADLLDATVRLMRLIERPGEYRAIAPLVIREIVYRLLTGAQGSRMRHLAMLGGQAHRMVRAVEKLREKFDKPLRIESIARELGMSLSGFHAHFKAVTAMSPLQFQKQIRLQEARRLMLGENLDAAEAGYRVGYDDASHFSRDYKRHFGEPPMRNIERLRELAPT
ncbi:MAG: Transcriptional regulator, AraC family [Phycisphaerales bacterium]|nr:Transcriptional regulator, AraC family [Phycisphaerales bacterium]